MIKTVKVLLVICVVILSLECCKSELDPRTIVLKSLEAHGGLEKWNRVKEISYKKTTVLYDSLGAIEKQIVQTHKNTFNPKFKAEMIWVEDTIQKKVILENDKISVYFDDVLQSSPELQKKYYNSITAAHYVIWQPFKLLDKTVTLSYVGIDTVEDEEVDVVKASYFKPNGSPSNTWWYYFDVKSYKLIGNMVHHGTTYSYIVNTKHEDKTGLSLNAKRKSYLTDSLRNPKFLRADYTYEILEFN
ncbi:hypothetical protein SAMN04487910_4106 [Aquimarina amphilecti]|uniref:Uncharacterized protein n=1 Tax=Aquimarina amphilecti TaxID=1038014 RepID=A0A1H7VI27_AQUAM|nr:DUF6503 family protein [Aquimarina amphilecti]SEM08559.1 hypothetical protein SAMN04487910_4106 [Aquimarina amphilecti]